MILIELKNIKYLKRTYELASAASHIIQNLFLQQP